MENKMRPTEEFQVTMNLTKKNKILLGIKGNIKLNNKQQYQSCI